MTQTNASPKAVDKASSKVGRGRPRKDPSAVKRQCSFSLTDESISQLKEMALAQGISASEFLGQLIGKAYASKQHLKGLAALTQDERDALNKKRACGRAFFMVVCAVWCCLREGCFVRFGAASAHRGMV